EALVEAGRNEVQLAFYDSRHAATGAFREACLLTPAIGLWVVDVNLAHRSRPPYDVNLPVNRIRDRPRDFYWEVGFAGPAVGACVVGLDPFHCLKRGGVGPTDGVQHVLPGGILDDGPRHGPPNGRDRGGRTPRTGS